MRLALAIVAATGCGFPTPSKDYACTENRDCEDHPGTVCSARGYCVSGTPSDAGADAPDAPDADLPMSCTSWPAPPHFDPCAIGPIPTTGLDLNVAGQYTYNTTTGELSAPNSVTLPAPTQSVVNGSRLISVAYLTIGASTRLRVIGDKPLIVASWSSIEVSGQIDVSSSVANGLGAGANPAPCATHAATVPPTNPGGGGGGGGGGFQGRGGTGGVGEAAGTAGSPGTGGAPVGAPLLLGGCNGTKGGDANKPGGAGGAGGGAVQLTARLSITIPGIVHAGGAGGRGAPTNANGNGGGSGGGGGGSGGMVGLDAPTINVTGTLAANGGAGGEGADSSAGELDGANGQDGLPSATSATTPNMNVAGNGGVGSGGATLDGGTGTSDNTDGGGGGGGGAGFIVVRSPNRNLSGTVSPPALP